MYDKHVAYQNLTYFRSKSKSFDSGVNIEIYFTFIFFKIK